MRLFCLFSNGLLPGAYEPRNQSEQVEQHVIFHNLQCHYLKAMNCEYGGSEMNNDKSALNLNYNISKQ